MTPRTPPRPVGIPQPPLPHRRPTAVGIGCSAHLGRLARARFPGDRNIHPPPLPLPISKAIPTPSDNVVEPPAVSLVGSAAEPFHGDLEPSLPPPEVGSSLEIVLPEGVVIALVGVSAGSFFMGSPEGEVGRFPDESMRRVTLTEPFWLARTPTTVKQWCGILREPIRANRDGRLPIRNISWADCHDFIKRLVAPHGWRWDLPTEAQWEYACRAGTEGPYAGDLDDLGWYRGNSLDKPHPVGEKAANAWGLFDMHGNVYEWCRDWLGQYRATQSRDPKGPSKWSERACRGGSYMNCALRCRSAFRNGGAPGLRARYIGMRLALVLSGAAA